MSLQEMLAKFLGPSDTRFPACVQETQTEQSLPSTYLLTLKASEATKETYTGSYDKPNIYRSFTPSKSPLSNSLTFLAFQCSEFALPIRADASLSFNFFSRPGFTRPHTVFPLLAFLAGECLLIAPIDSFHDQVLAIRDNNILWGWSGDLEQVPEGFSTSLAIIQSQSPREALQEWGKLVRTCAGRTGLLNEKGRYADASVAKLSYWTDNGSAYWYRTESGMDLPTTLERTITALDDDDVPVAAVELDSWFYPHQVTRKVTDVGYLDVVPPTGMLCWEPRSDVLPDGIVGLRKRLGNRPLILHSRHMSVENIYMVEDAKYPSRRWWKQNDRAHPADGYWFQTWMDQASSWGAITYEQDWLVEVWLGVRDLRSKPGRIAQWQRQLDHAGAQRGISLIWCMATPADMATAVSLRQIVAVRSCDDYRYADDPSTLWRWHLTTSALIHSLGLWPYKDVFMSHGTDSGYVDINGDPNALLEACLAALSAGPFGIGDRLGRTNKDVVMKACRSDGTIVKPDRPLMALDRSLRNANGLLWADTCCESVCGSWRYIVAIRTGKKNSEDPLHKGVCEESLPLRPKKDVLVYDWKTAETWLASEQKYELAASLRLHEWSFWVICPIVRHSEPGQSGEVAFTVIGDRNTFATTGDRRFKFHRDVSSPPAAGNESHLSEAGPVKDSRNTPRIDFDVLGVHGENIDVAYWSEAHGLATKTIAIPAKGWISATVRYDAGQGKVVLEHENRKHARGSEKA